MESTYIAGPLKVDRDKGIIHGVKLVGRVSVANRGIYPRDVLEAAVAEGLYEGCKCNINHRDKTKPAADRSAYDRFGIFHNTRVAGDGNDYGVYGDLHALVSHAMWPKVAEAAESDDKHDAFAFSHDARTVPVENGDGTVTHKKILRVRYTDLVADGATTKNIFESQGSNMDEQENAGALSPAPTLMAGNAAGSEANDSVAFDVESSQVDQDIDRELAYFLPTMQDTDADPDDRAKAQKDCISKVSAILKGVDVGGKSTTDEEIPAEGTTEEATAALTAGAATPTEPTLAELKAAKDVCESAGLGTDFSMVEQVARHPADGRTALVALLKGAKVKPAAVPAKPKGSSVMESAGAAGANQPVAKANRYEIKKEDLGTLAAKAKTRTA
jgi:hypothetical protein